MHFGIFEGQPEYLHLKFKFRGISVTIMFSLLGKVRTSLERVVNGAREIVDKHPNQSILAVSHAGALMTFLHAVEPERAFSHVQAIVPS
ncbi:MAG: histidine phosphatase family protein [Streptococcus sp.]